MGVHGEVNSLVCLERQSNCGEEVRREGGEEMDSHLGLVMWTLGCPDQMGF